MRRAATVAVALAFIAGARPAPAADWVDVAFPDRSHDFGTVARGSKIRHSFRVVNSTAEEIHIASWRTKCGCTDVRVGARDIPPGTQTVVEATIDTTRFEGYKASGLFLVLDRPQPREVELNLTCFIRPDLVLNPGQADFGVVNRSAGPKVELALNYGGGKADWAVTKMETISDHMVAELREVSRSPGGAVQYVLSATLKPSAPVGFFKDEITLRTNDPTAPVIPVSVSAVVQSNVSATPSVFNLGRIRAGESVQKTFVVRSNQPFKVVGVKPSRDEITSAQPAAESRPTQTVTFTFKAPATPGPFHATVDVETDVKGEPPARVSTFATVVP